MIGLKLSSMARKIDRRKKKNKHSLSEGKSSIREEKAKKMGGEGQLLRRIPRIKFPNRHSSSSVSQGLEPATATTGKGKMKFTMASGSDIPPSISETTGGKASLQPKRTPVTDREIEAVMLGGCF